MRVQVELKLYWIEAGKLANKIAKKFFSQVSYDDFVSKDGRKCYTFKQSGRFNFVVKIRHAKDWSCFYDETNDEIKINVNKDCIQNEPSCFGTRRPEWQDTFVYLLTHEITHYLQSFYVVEDGLDEEQSYYYELSGNGSKSSAGEMFLYFTNYLEMDANLSALCNLMRYKPFDKEVLTKFYKWVYSFSPSLLKIVVEYVYGYWWK